MRLLTVAYLLLASLILPGCTPLLIVGAAAGVSLANDRRGPATIIDDQSIEVQIRRQLRGDSTLASDSHISVTSFNRVVLLTGQVRDQRQHQQASVLAQKREDIKRVHNELVIATPTPQLRRNQDAWLTTKVKSALLHHASLNALQIKVVTEDSTVHLMGLVSQAEGRAAALTAQQVVGVTGVIKVFEYID